MTFYLGLLIFTYCLIVSSPARAATIDFESLPDSTILTNQYSGLTFSNAIILTAGISLNEFEFPPHSGTNVVADNNGPMNVAFSSPVSSFSGYFTYSEPLTLQAFNAASVQIASATSLFSANYVSSGNPPSEFLQVVSASGISSVTIMGDPAGGSFVMDDIAYTSAATGVPEPGTFSLFLIFGLGTLALRRLKA